MNIAVLVPTGGKIRPNSKRTTYDSFGFLGMQILIDELAGAGLPVSFCTVQTMYLHDVVLWSITAQEDIYAFLRQVAAGSMRKGGAQIIVGGAGCINITPIYDYIDAAVFGRAEGLIVNIVDGARHESVWRKADDPGLSNKYVYRQAQHLDSREGGTCGCKNKCYFCHYTWTHKQIGGNYSPTKSALGAGGRVVNEEDFTSLSLDKPGRYTTAFDGMTEETRRRVNKGFVTDALILDKFSKAIACDYDKAIMLKIFSIVGYPWESLHTARAGADSLGRLLHRCRGAGEGRIMGAIHLTPFSPEPLTPMEHCPANVKINWRRAFGGRSYALVNIDEINIFIGPYTTTAPTLIRRVLINRSTLPERDKIIAILTSKIDGVSGAVLQRRISEYLGRDIFGWQYSSVVPYLQTYSDPSKVGKKQFPPPPAPVIPSGNK